MASWLDALLFGVRQVFAGASQMPERPGISFSGAGVVVTDDPTNNRTSVVISAGGATPTGTGIPHVIAGAYAAAATKIVDGDVDPAAAIASTKLAPGANGQWFTTTGGAAAWATPSWVNADINAAAAIALSKLATTGALQSTTLVATGAVTGVPLRGGGGTFPTAGKLQFGNVAQVVIAFREISNSTDINIVEVASGSNLIFGNQNWSNLTFDTWSGGVFSFRVATNLEKVRFDASADTAELSLALAGALSGAVNQPFRLKYVAYAMPSDANQTLAKAQYACPAIEVVGGTTLTAIRSITLPTIRGALYVVRNASAGGFGLTFKTSLGTGPTIATGTVSIIYCNGTDYLKIV